MATSILESLKRQIQAEIDFRKEPDALPTRNTFLELRFANDREYEAGKEYFRALYATYTGDMISELQTHMSEKGAEKALKPALIEEIPAEHRLRFQLFAKLPLRSMLHDIEEMQITLRSEPPPTLRIPDIPGKQYVAIFMSPRSFTAVTKAVTALVQLHDEGYNADTIVTASEGLGVPYGPIPGNTPVVMVERSAYDKIAAAEKGEARSEGFDRGKR